MFYNSKFFILALTISLPILTGCKKSEDGWGMKTPNFTNCKLPIADGRGGVAIGGFPRYSERLPSTGTVNATVIMVDFPDAAAAMSTNTAFANISGATATFTEMSYSRMNYVLNPVHTWYRMSKNSTEYDLNTSAGHLSYVQEAVALADSAVDFSNTDSLIILANPDSTGIGERGPSIAASYGNGVTADGNEMLNIATSGHDLNTWGSIWLNHEVTHTLGLVDLYAYTQKDPSNSYDTLRYTGTFSYMGYNSFSSKGPGLTAWERWVLEWLDDDQIVCSNPRLDGTITQLITPVGSSGGVKAVVVPIGATKVLVVESRRATGIDASLAKAGALVYTVDSSIQSGYGPIQVYPINSTDTLYYQSVRANGESVSVAGYTVVVTDSTESGDTVRITAD